MLTASSFIFNIPTHGLPDICRERAIDSGSKLRCAEHQSTTRYSRSRVTTGVSESDAYCSPFETKPHFANMSKGSSRRKMNSFCLVIRVFEIIFFDHKRECPYIWRHRASIVAEGSTVTQISQNPKTNTENHSTKLWLKTIYQTFAYYNLCITSGNFPR